MPATKIKQRDLTDCGAACLASIAGFYKLNLPVARIRQLASTDKKGTNVLGLIEAANKIGFDAKGVRGEFSSLVKVPKPAIAHVTVNGVLQHYVVLTNTTAKFVEAMDPADGKLHKYAHDEFKKIWTGVLVLLLPNQTFKPGDKRISNAVRFWKLIRPHRSVMTQAFFGALVYTLIGLSTSIYVQKIVDHVLVGGNENLLNLMSIVMIVFLCFQVFVGSTKSIFTLRTGQMIDSQLILGYYKHLLKLPQQFFDTMRVGEIISRINDAVKIRAFINDISINLVVNAFVVVFAFAMMFTYYWKLALIVLLVIPLYAVIYWISNRLNRKTERTLMERSAELETQLVESLNSIGTIKSFGLEANTNLKTEIRFISLLKSVYTSGVNSVITGSSSEMVSRFFTIILLWTGARFVIDDTLTPGELLSFYALIGYFTGPVGGLIGMNKSIQNALIAADRLFEIIDLEHEENENKVKVTSEMIGDIKFQDVNFRYGARTLVFQDLNVLIPKGKVTAIVGESGSGKSTLISILQNLYPVTSGNIHIGDYDLKYLDKDSLRRLISVVPQKIDLFAGNVIENIAVGDFEPDMKKLVGICSTLGMLTFIEKLPHGFNTYIGENGTSLSGGQRQRLAVARALYREPEILIMDEATSSVDSTSESHIWSAIKVMRNKAKTIILITHRLDSTHRADKIIVLDGGRVIEEGTHAELLRKNSEYSALWSQQRMVRG
jgi:ATP-binding cassette, subfamily C, bacteriocin exporter